MCESALTCLYTHRKISQTYVYFLQAKPTTVQRHLVCRFDTTQAPSYLRFETEQARRISKRSVCGGLNTRKCTCWWVQQWRSLANTSPPPAQTPRYIGQFMTAQRSIIFVVSALRLFVGLLRYNMARPASYLSRCCMYRQFNATQFYVLPTQCMCVLCGSENKQRLIICTASNAWFLQQNPVVITCTYRQFKILSSTHTMYLCVFRESENSNYFLIQH
jgi:hypothetical protein